MSLTHLSPTWFYGYNALLEGIIAVVALLVCLIAFKVYRLTQKQSVGYFSLSFLFLSLGFFTQAVFSIAILNRLSNICVWGMQSMALLDRFGMYMSMVLILAGLVTLVYMTLKVENSKVLALLYVLTLVAIFSTPVPPYAFFAILVLFYALIVTHFVTTYKKNHSHQTLLLIFAFVLLLIGSLEHFFAMISQTMYVAGHLFNLFAFVIIAIQLVMVLKSR